LELPVYRVIEQIVKSPDNELGHNIVAPKDTPLCNTWLTMLHGIGVNVERHGDSSGVLKEIVA
jgi:hypothetical protein